MLIWALLLKFLGVWWLEALAVRPFFRMMGLLTTLWSGGNANKPPLRVRRLRSQRDQGASLVEVDVRAMNWALNQQTGRQPQTAPPPCHLSLFRVRG